MNSSKTPVKRVRRDVSPDKKIVNESEPMVKEEMTDQPFSHVPDALKTHCEKFTPVSPDDALATPQPRFLLAQGLNCFVLCRKCAGMGRNLLVTSLPDKTTGLVVPMCPSCSKANARISQASFYAGTIKSLVDTELEKESNSA